jgi:hypothetical protein
MAKLYTSDWTTGILQELRGTGLVFSNPGYHFGHSKTMRDQAGRVILAI